MDHERAGELLAQESERIERALGGLAHTDTGEEADDIDPGNPASDLYQDALDEGLADGLREQLVARERAAGRTPRPSHADASSSTPPRAPPRCQMTMSVSGVGRRSAQSPISSIASSG